MLSRFARVLMVLTALAPVALVHGATMLPSGAASASWWFLVSALLSLLCFLMLKYVRTHAQRETLIIERTEIQDKDVLTFIVSYSLPLLKPSGTNEVGLLVFFAIVVTVLYQAEVLNVNPILGMFGYQFHKATTSSGATYLVITAKRHATLRGEIQAARITDHVWLLLEGK